MNPDQCHTFIYLTTLVAQMLIILGIRSILDDDDCEQVLLSSSSAEALKSFSRVSDSLWTIDGKEDHRLDVDELTELLHEALGNDFDCVTCLLTTEKVVYRKLNKKITIKREVRRDNFKSFEDSEGAKFLFEAMGVPGSKRKTKVKQAYHFAKVVETALSRSAQKGSACKDIAILDLASGRNYLGFVLAHLLSARGFRLRLHSVDVNTALVAKSEQIARALDFKNVTFEEADLASYSPASADYQILTCLHGCDTLTDDAIRIASEIQAPHVFLAPCCQHELRFRWGAHPLGWISRFGLLEQRMADLLTDGFRCLALESMGYRVNTIRFADSEITPKNLLIQGRLVSKRNEKSARAAREMLEWLEVDPASVLFNRLPKT